MKGHPGSGSGRIRFDGSSETELGEVKDASKSITLKLSYIKLLFDTAVRQGKEPRLFIRFPGYLIECRIRRDIK